MLRIVANQLLIVDFMSSYLNTLLDAPVRGFAAVDPDDRSTAIALCVLAADGYRVVELLGGGSEVVPWGSVTGALPWLRGASERLPRGEGPPTLVVEAQAGSGRHSEDVEGCRRARWHWDAAAELEGWARVHAHPADWESAFCPAGSVWRERAGTGSGAVKRAYQDRAREIDPRASNEDRAAAVGLAWWYAASLGVPLIG